MLQYTMGFTSYQHRRIGGCVQCMHALLHIILKRTFGGMPTLTTSAFAAEHRASNGWKRAGHEQVLDHCCDGRQISCPHLQGACFRTSDPLFAIDKLRNGYIFLCGSMMCRNGFQSGGIPKKGYAVSTLPHA